jgi:hypothetical protein
VTCLAADPAAKAGFFLGEQGPEGLDKYSVPGRFIGVDGEIVENDAWASATQAVQTCT